jgi:hypothetical protein
VLLSGYGSAGVVALDFLNYASRFGGSIPLALSFQLFLPQVEMRHTKASTRQSILRTLRSMAGLHEAGLLRLGRAVWYAAERLICRAYWERVDRRERKSHLAMVRLVHHRETAGEVAPLRQLVLTGQTSLLAVLADEMLWHAMEELLELRGQMPKTAVTSRRFEAARVALESNLRSLLQYEFREENEDVREVA